MKTFSNEKTFPVKHVLVGKFYVGTVNAAYSLGDPAMGLYLRTPPPRNPECPEIFVYLHAA